MPPRVLVLFNEPTLPADHPDADSEHDILYTADTVARSRFRRRTPKGRRSRRRFGSVFVKRGSFRTARNPWHNSSPAISP